MHISLHTCEIFYVRYWVKVYLTVSVPIGSVFISFESTGMLYV